MTKYINKIRERFGSYDYPVFTITDLRVFLGNTRISQRYLKLLINHLIRRKEITRISRGAYTFHKEMAVVGFAYSPFYYGMEDALSYRNLWTQSANPTIITTRNVRNGLRKFVNSNYMVKQAPTNLFFGFDFIKYYELWIPVSDPEKTLIDLVYYNHDIRVDALEKLADALNRRRLAEYLEHYSKNFRKKVMGILKPNLKQKEATTYHTHSSRSIRIVKVS